jgi:hypothetical protein
MNDFLRSDKEIDAAVNAATNFEQMREAMLSTLANRGVLARSRTDAFDIRVIKTPELDAPPAPAAELSASANPTCVRVIYPRQNDRLEIYGNSEAELDGKEARIRQLYGS